MYSRQPMGRFPKGMRVPENYSGNAFAPRASSASDSQDTEDGAQDVEVPDIRSETEASVSPSERSADSRPTFKFDLGRFFSGSRGFGMEDFLIIALILLLAQNDSSDDTLIFLVLLLFIR